MQSNCSILIKNNQNETLSENNCSVCYKEFLYKNDLLTHYKIIHRPITTSFENNTNNCAFCETCELFYEEDSYTDHFPCNAVDIRCFFCLTTMPIKSHFSSHNLTYHSWRKFQCNLCEIDTKEMTFAELNEHMKLHNEFGCGVYQCVNCDLFMEKSALPGHVEQCHRGCRCFNMNEICVCDRFNEAFYITKILLADIALQLHKASLDLSMTSSDDHYFPDENWSVEFVDEITPSKEELKNSPIIPSLLLEVQLESEPENFEDEMNTKNPDFENIYLSENYQQMISNLKSEDFKSDRKKTENYQEKTTLIPEQVEENIRESSHDIEDKSESETSHLKSEREERNHKRGRKKKYKKRLISKKSKRSSKSECVVCGWKFETELEVHDHGVIHHRPWAVEVLKDIFCVRCKSWFNSEDEYQTHNPCSEEPATNRCPICCMQLPFKEHFLLHYVNFISYKRLNCLLCNDRSTEYQIHQLNKHRQTEHNKNGVFECLKCEVNFERSCDLKRHLIESCSKNDVESIAETYKLKINDIDLPEHYKCEICNRLLFSKKHLKEHTATHDHGGIKLCFVCGQIFKDTSHYKDHVNTHLKTKSYECPLCDKKFLKLKHLRQHEKTHKDNKDFPCSFCSKTFAQQTSLIYHMAGHTKENVFVCSVCGEKWDTQRKLTSHMDVHNADGTNPHKCHVCLKYFTHKCNLLVHMRTHAQKNKNK